MKIGKKIIAFVAILTLMSGNLAFAGENKIMDINYDESFSQNGITIKKIDGKSIIVKDGVESKLYDKILIIYESQGKPSFIAQKGKTIFVIKEGQEIANYINGSMESVYSIDKKSFSFLTYKNNKIVLVKDGIENNQYINIDSPRYSKDGKKFAFIGVINNTTKKILVINDREIGEKYDGIAIFQFSPEGDGYAFLARKEGKTILVKDGKEIDKYEDIYSFKYGLKEGNFAFTALKEGKQILVKNDVEIKKCYRIKNFKFGEDGKTLLFDCVDNQNSVDEPQKEETKKQFEESKNTDKKETPKTTDYKTEKIKYLKQSILSKSNLIKAKQTKYITQVDKIVIASTKEKLQKKFDILQKKEKKTDKEKYLEAKVYLEILKK